MNQHLSAAADSNLPDVGLLTSLPLQLPLNSSLPLRKVMSERRMAVTDFDRGSDNNEVEIPTRIARLAPHVINVKGYVAPKVGALAAVLQVWEGVVLEVDPDQQIMLVKLADRQGLVAEHTAELGLDWVVAQDMELVRPGAVFYWTIYRETKRSTIKHSQEIRFRRLPNWTNRQVEAINSKATALLSKLTVARQAT